MNVLLPILIAVVVFVVSAAASHAFPQALRDAHPWIGQAVIKGLLIAISLVLMKLTRRPFADFGFRRATAKSKRWIAAGFALGALATILMLSSGLKGLAGALKGYTLPMLMFWVWIVSSVSEEIFVRGWFQSTLAHRGVSQRAAVITSGALFGAMHLSLLMTDVERASVAMIVTFTFLLGLVCAYVRATRDSLMPAILAHVGFNVGGLFGGAIFMIAKKLAHR